MENTTSSSRSAHRASLRVLAMLTVGAVVAGITGVISDWGYAAVFGWIAAALTYTGWVWLRIGRMDSAATRSHALREDPSRAVADILLVVASVASLGVVAFVLVRASTMAGIERALLASLAIAAVALSWMVIHTLYTLRYASLYYSGEPGGVDFGQGSDGKGAEPDYGDFAYLSFTLGMTYQVSDTGLRNRAFRVTALRQGLLSYVFGAVILATTINLVAGLGS